MIYKVFIDGQAGTAGLELASLLEERSDISLLKIADDKRKDIREKIKFFKEADISFMCLPDDSSIETMKYVPDDAKVIDTSTAHRISDGWTYGLAQIGKRNEIAAANRVSNPGCHATAFLLAVKPLVDMGVLKKSDVIAVTSITGYSGGGKLMISEYEDKDRNSQLDSPAAYALAQNHKHLQEMTIYSGLEHEPIFMPVVADYYRGMMLQVPIVGGPTPCELSKMFADYYKDEDKVIVSMAEGARIYANEMAGTDRCHLIIHGNEKRQIVTSCIDNLGKGAAAAAVENMDIMLGI